MKRVLAILLVLITSSVLAEGMPLFEKTVSEMRTHGASARSGISDETGFYIVGIGRSRYLYDEIDKCREIARANAIKEIASAMETCLKARDEVGLTMKIDGDAAEARAFVLSLTETKVESLMKGVEIIGSYKNADGEMEVAACMTAKRVNYNETFAGTRESCADKGTVKAIGIDTCRAMAEKNALRSAVEQVAGTLVVGKVVVNEREDMHKRLATTAGALVEEYRIIEESRIGSEHKVVVVAKVDKRKLYDDYKSFFKCLHDPIFCIDATDESLKRHFTQFFIDKGFCLTTDPTECHYVIKLDGKFVERPTPSVPNSVGTMLNLNVRIESADGKRVLMSLNDRQSKDSLMLTAEQRHEETARRIFNKLELKLHQAIQDMVVRLLDEADPDSGDKVKPGTNLID